MNPSDPAAPWTRADPPSEAEARALGESLHRAHVHAASQRIAGRVRRTPALRLDQLSRELEVDLWIKCENLQHIGAFKARGALHAVGRIPVATRARGVLTFSSGNHAQAVALAARTFGISAHICMPTDAPAVKVEGVRALGASIEFAGTTSEERKAACLARAAETGGIVIQPFDHADIVCGAGTASLEFREQVREATGAELDHFFVPVGGGGVIAGACLAYRDRGKRHTKIWAVEPVGCDAMGQSLAAGTRVAVEPAPTLADGLKPVRVGALNFEIARRDLAGAHTVDDAALRRATVDLFRHAKLCVEPSGAAGLAALRAARAEGRIPAGARIGLMITGGNVDGRLFAELLSAPTTEP